MDWIVNVTINKAPTIQNNSNIPESKKSSSANHPQKKAKISEIKELPIKEMSKLSSHLTSSDIPSTDIPPTSSTDLNSLNKAIIFNKKCDETRARKLKRMEELKDLTYLNCESMQNDMIIK